MENNRCSHYNVNSDGILGGAYILTIIGAAVYFLQNSSSFWGGVLGILKACVWPAFAVYKVLELLNL